jgi:hypothetical protein
MNDEDSEISPSLYGLTNLSKDLSQEGSWGKNQFNNLFPMALSCYMRDQGIDLPYLQSEKSEIKISTISIDDIFGTSASNSDLFFDFESKFEPFRRFVSDQLESIDVVICNMSPREPLRPLEIKLTTLPDNSTKGESDDKYGSELVIRDKTTRYMALSIVQSCESNFSSIRNLFDPQCKHVRAWDSVAEMQPKLKSIIDCLERFVTQYSSYQKPMLLQPIWKTEGQTSKLASNCLDIFVWSDFGLASLFIKVAKNGIKEGKINRPQRAILRLARFLWEASSGQPVHQAPIYDDMTFGTLNDKECSISGRQTNPVMKHPRLTNPHLQSDVLPKIILGGGERLLKPERRFDAVIYYTLGSLSTFRSDTDEN